MCEEREKTNKMQQLYVYYQLLSQHVSGYHYAHLQENKEPVTAFGVLFWFCWMWLVAVGGRCLKGSVYFLQDSAPQPLPITSSRTRTIHQMQ
jgi:hypothetical protein